MTRNRKQTANVIAEVKDPQVLITRQQYIQDIKVRWQIHQTEINNLVEDVRKVVNVCSPYVQKALNFLTEKYQQVSAKYAAH